MELRQIEYVVGIVDHGGFTRAAQALHVTQPALSEGVSRLESELGVALFHRVPKGVVMTSAGSAFMEPARQMLRTRTVLSESVAAVAGLAAGQLDLVALPTLAVDPLASLIGEFRNVHPGISVHVAQPEDAAAVATRVRNGSSEIGLAELPVEGAGLVSEPLLVQQLVVSLPAQSALAGRRRLRITDLAKVPLITTPTGTSLRRLVDMAFIEAGLTPLIAVETEQRESVLPLVAAGAGATVLPKRLADTATDPRIVTADLYPAIRREIGLIRRNGPVSPAAQAFLDISLADTSPASAFCSAKRLP